MLKRGWLRILEERKITDKKRFEFINLFRKPESWRPLKIALLVIRRLNSRKSGMTEHHGQG